MTCQWWRDLLHQIWESLLLLLKPLIQRLTSCQYLRIWHRMIKILLGYWLYKVAQYFRKELCRNWVVWLLAKGRLHQFVSPIWCVRRQWSVHVPRWKILLLSCLIKCPTRTLLHRIQGRMIYLSLRGILSLSVQSRPQHMLALLCAVVLGAWMIRRRVFQDKKFAARRVLL